VRGEKISNKHRRGKKRRKTFQISDDKEEEEIFFCCPDDATFFFLNLGSKIRIHILYTLRSRESGGAGFSLFK
jgi:hypothetical protein